MDITRRHKQDMADAIEKLLPASRQRKQQAMDLALAVDGAIIRVRYQATEDQARRVDHDGLRSELLAGGASRVTIEPQIIRKERARSQQISEQLSPVDALAEYCDANGVEPDRALAMLARLKEWSE